MRAVDVPVDGSDGVGRARVLDPFAEFYREHYGPMVRLARALVDSAEVAEEVVQDAFAAVYGRFDRLDNPAAYLRTSVVNNSKNVVRHRSVVRRRGHAVTVESKTDDYDHIFDVLRRLPARQRRVVVLKYQAGLSEAEIAATLNISVGTVKSRLSRSKDFLRKELQP